MNKEVILSFYHDASTRYRNYSTQSQTTMSAPTARNLDANSRNRRLELSKKANSRKQIGKNKRGANRTKNDIRFPRYYAEDFKLHPHREQLKDAEISEYPYLVFGEPETVRYTTAGGNVARLRVPISALFEPETILGYLPLPTRYQLHWKQLCYTIVYHRCVHATLRNFEKDKRYPFARDCARSVSAVLKYQLYCRARIIEEIFSKKGSFFDTIPVFDEYIIKERWDLHWTEPEEYGKTRGAACFGMSPFDEEVAKALGKSYVHLTAQFANSEPQS